MRQIKVPFLRSSEIDQAVADLLRRYGTWRNEPTKPPIDVDEIVEGYLGLVLEIADLKSLLGMPDVLGATWFEKRKVCVDQSLEGKEGRFAFTVAHEIGHWQLHRPLLEMEAMTLSLFLAAADAAPTVVCRARESKAPAEWQADQFAINDRLRRGRNGACIPSIENHANDLRTARCQAGGPPAGRWHALALQWRR